MNKKIIISVVAAALLAGFAGGFYFGDYWSLPNTIGGDLINRDKNKPQDVDFNMFWQVWGLLKEKYVDRDQIDAQKLLYGAISGMVDAVGDPYTVFMTPKESEDFSQEIGGEFGGIGIEIGIRNDILTVIAPIKNTPAERAGIMAGDRILKIGDKITEGMTTGEAVTLIRGPLGTTVKLTIARDKKGSDSREIAIIRDKIKVPTVSLEILDGNVAHIGVFVFNKNVDSDFKELAKEVENSTAQKIILDLRNNPGGLLESAINLAGYFLGSDMVVVKQKTADGQELEFKSWSSGRLKRYPIVILLNKGSASASEILAGAIKDQRGVLIVGEKSFGKGSVQKLEELPGKSSVKITIAKWLTPKGTSINDEGISPDVFVERTEEDINNNRDPQLDKAVELMKSL